MNTSYRSNRFVAAALMATIGLMLSTPLPAMAQKGKKSKKSTFVKPEVVKIEPVAGNPLIASMVVFPNMPRRCDAVLFSPDGKLLAVGAASGTLQLWDVETFKQVANLKGHNGLVWRLAFSPDGETLVSGDDQGFIKLWDVDSAKLSEDLSGHVRSIRALRYSPDGSKILSVSEDGKGRLWNVNKGTLAEILEGHTKTIRDGMFTADGKSVVTLGEDEKLIVWDAKSGKQRTTISTSATEFDLGADNSTLALLLERNSELRSLEKSSENKALPMVDSDFGKLLMYCIAISPNNNLLVYGGGYQQSLGCLVACELPSGKQIGQFIGKGQAVSDLAFAPDGKYLAGAAGGQLILFDTSNASAIAQVPTRHNVIDIAYSPDGRFIATVSGDADGKAKLWDVAKLLGSAAKNPPDAK